MNHDNKPSSQEAQKVLNRWASYDIMTDREWVELYTVRHYKLYKALMESKD